MGDTAQNNLNKGNQGHCHKISYAFCSSAKEKCFNGFPSIWVPKIKVGCKEIRLQCKTK